MALKCAKSYLQYFGGKMYKQNVGRKVSVKNRNEKSMNVKMFILAPAVIVASAQEFI
jgi:hypothetical protein